MTGVSRDLDPRAFERERFFLWGFLAAFYRYRPRAHIADPRFQELYVDLCGALDRETYISAKQRRHIKHAARVILAKISHDTAWEPVASRCLSAVERRRAFTRSV